jgi:hypothetical protein
MGGHQVGSKRRGIAAPVVPSEVARRGSTRDLGEQFVLSRSLDTPDGFESESVGHWRLAHHPTLPVIHLDDPSGIRLGWLLGYPITSEPELLRGGSTVTLDADADPLAFVDDLGGRFLAVFVHGPSPAVYPDAAASYASVFCPSMQVAASTASLIPYDSGTGTGSISSPTSTSRSPPTTSRSGSPIVTGSNNSSRTTTWTCNDGRASATGPGRRSAAV